MSDGIKTHLGERCTVLVGTVRGTSLAAGIVVGFRSSARGNSFTVRTEDGVLEGVPASRDYIAFLDSIDAESVEFFTPAWERLEVAK